MARRSLLAAGAGTAALLALLPVMSPPPAAAASTTGLLTGATVSGQAFASAAYAGSAAMSPSLALTGSLGGLLNGLVDPIVKNALNPLVSALTGTSSGTIGTAIGTYGAASAGQPSTTSTVVPGTFPGDLPGGLPATCPATTGAQPCYRITNVSANAAPLSSVGASSLLGYTEAESGTADTSNPIFGRAQDTNVSTTVLAGATGLANPVVSTGVVDSVATCPNDGTTDPSGNASATNVSILQGAVTLSVSNGVIASITVNGTTYASIDAVPTSTSSGVTVQAVGQDVAVTVPLSITQLANGLGLSATATSLLQQYATAGTSLGLTMLVGPHVALTNSSVTSWGLGVGVDLSGSLSFNLAGVVGASVTVPSGIGGTSYGNLLDLRLAYTSCTTGASAQGAQEAVPITLI